MARKLVPVRLSVCAPDPTSAEAGERLVKLGTPTPMVSVKVALPVPPLLVALRVTVEVAAAVGVPEINPVVLLRVKHAGNPAAP